MLLTHIHLFESRKEIFDEDDILQENIILGAVKTSQNQFEQGSHIIVSTSQNKSFYDLQTFDLHYGQVVFRNKANTFIRIPSSPTEIQVLQVVDNWTNTLHSLGLEISTGPVVPFRAKEHLCHEDRKDNLVPLLWMHNLREWSVEWPKSKNVKEQFIRQNEDSQRLLLPMKNYVLLKRFSSKEQRRRLYAAVLLQSEFRQYPGIGIENHLNYIHRPEGVLSEDEVYGIAAFLNTLLIDVYFRVLNGNTQVNASDIRILPLPSGDTIREIGAYIMRRKPSIGDELDKAIAGILDLDPKIVDELIHKE
jgi:adenine-specific DNA-methyltransferase